MGSTLNGTQIPQMTKSQEPVPQEDLHIVNSVFGKMETGADALAEALRAGGAAVYECPYDWRQSIDAIAEKYLKPTIDKALKETGKSKVLLLAHSMGGLVSRAYIQSDYYNYDVDSMIMLGTPNEGSTEIVPLAMFGTPFTPAHNLVLVENYNKMTGNKAKKASKKEIINFVNNNMTGAAQLMPDYNNYLFTGIMDRFDNGRNQFLEALNSADCISNLYESYEKGKRTDKVNTLLIGADDKDTPLMLFTTTDRKSLVSNGKLPKLTGTSAIYNQLSKNGDYYLSMTSLGDGTVLRTSAKGIVHDLYKNWDTDFSTDGSHMSLMISMKKKAINAIKKRVSIDAEAALASVDMLSDTEQDLTLTEITVDGAKEANLTINETVVGDISQTPYSTNEITEGNYSITLKKTDGEDFASVSVTIIDAQNAYTADISTLEDEYTFDFTVTNGEITANGDIVDNLRSFEDNSLTALSWDSVNDAVGYRIYKRPYNGDFEFIAEVSENEYTTDVLWQQEFDTSCTMFYVVPVFSEYVGGFDGAVYNFNDVRAVFDYRIDNENPSIIQFTNESTGDITSYEWDFDGDGTVDSTEENPQYTFDDGKHSVILTVSGPYGSDTVTTYNSIKTGDYIEALEASVSKTALQPEDTAQITVSALKTESDDEDISDKAEYTSWNEAVATVDENGIVSAISEGIADITVSYEELSYVITVNVTDKELYISDMTKTDTVYEIVMTNTVDTPVEAQIFVAEYDDYGYLTGVHNKACTIASGENTVVLDDVQDSEVSSKVRIFVWNSIDGMTPISNVYEFNIE